MTAHTDAGTAPSPAPKQRKRKAPSALGPIQVLNHTNLQEWQWTSAIAEGLIPADGPPWPLAITDDVRSRRDAIVAVVGAEAPCGGHKAASRLAQRTGLEVEKWDVEALVDAEILKVHSYYKEWPVYDSRHLDEITVDQLEPVVAERLAWMEASVHASVAADYLGWRWREFQQVRSERELQTGSYDRFAKADLDALATDEDLVEQLRLDRLLTAQHAAQHLEIRPTDFKYLLAADLATPKTYTSVTVSRHRDVIVPLYRTGDLDALREHPDIDWEAIRSVRAGDPSPLRDLAHRPIDRAGVIRRWLAQLGDRHGIETWAWWHPGAGQWEIDFERSATSLTVKQVREEIDKHPLLRRYRQDIAVATEAGAALRWARAMREPGTAVILDTETTDLDGYVVEIAIVDAATGETLLDTLVNPGCPIELGAQWVHGLGDSDVKDAPTWTEVLPRLLEVTAGRTVVAYNSAFDFDVVRRHSSRDGLDPGPLDDHTRWACLMNRRSDWQLCRRWLPLNGGHRALGDCQTAYDLLCAMTSPSR